MFCYRQNKNHGFTNPLTTTLTIPYQYETPNFYVYLWNDVLKGQYRLHITLWKTNYLLGKKQTNKQKQNKNTGGFQPTPFWRTRVNHIYVFISKLCLDLTKNEFPRDIFSYFNHYKTHCKHVHTIFLPFIISDVLRVKD